MIEKPYLPKKKNAKNEIKLNYFWAEYKFSDD